MKTKDDLRKLLLSIDHRGYPAYKDTRGRWQYGNYILSIDHVQGDPYASPSNVSVIVPGRIALFPKDYLEPKYRRITLQDMLLRFFSRELSERSRDNSRPSGGRDSSGLSSGRESSRPSGARDGSGKSGLVAVSRPAQEIGFPANGRTINARALIRILDDFLPGAVASSLMYRGIDQNKLRAAIHLSDDQQFIREALHEKGLCAFVADGSVLPRQSGISPYPMKGAIPFRSPEELAVTLTLPHAGAVRGMGIRKGVTLIVGGGYHGKSTLLGALEKGVYNHIAGDGREYVITDESAVKVRAEDGRCISNVDISMFIKDLPNNKDTVHFSTQDASGSTSQAANVIEAVTSGAQLLLIDEDTSATNFMVRDELMARVVAKDKEPITPFISRIRDLYEKAGVSTILVAGSSGAFFHVADTVIQMDRYVPLEITAAAKAAASADSTAAAVSTATVYRAADFSLPEAVRIPNKNSALLREGRVKVKALSDDSFLLSRDEVDLRGLEQLVDREQIAALAHILKYAELHLIDGRLSFDRVLDRILELAESGGPEEWFDGSTVRCGLAYVRRAEIAGMINRYRKL